MESDTHTQERFKLEQQHHQGASWFFWIAGLSLVNSFIILSGNEWSFIVGLGITQVFDAFAVVLSAELGNAAMLVALVLDLLVAAVFVGFGIFARRGVQAVYVAGMILYALDGAIFLLVQDWLSIGFHVFALFCIYGGFKANRKLTEAGPQPVPSTA
jgi:hypothetical protein